MVKLTNGQIITEQEYIEILEKRLDETEKVINELSEMLKKINLK